MALLYKPKVNSSNVAAAVWFAVGVAYEIFLRHGHDCIVTSLTDGQHSRQSFHYGGWAVDLRTWHLPNQSLKDVILAELQEALQPLDYFVQYEPTIRESDRITRGEHFHIHYRGAHRALVPPPVGKRQGE